MRERIAEILDRLIPSRTQVSFDSPEPSDQTPWFNGGRDKRSLMLGGGVALIAISIGLGMQTFGGSPTLTASEPPTPLEVEEIVLTSASAAGLGAAEDFVVPEEALTPVVSRAEDTAPTQLEAVALEGPTPDVLPETLTDTPSETVTMAQLGSEIRPGTSEPALEACEITMSSRALVAAMVSLEVQADCLPGERFVLHHNGMMFSALTDPTGRAKLTVPALSENAVFIASFGNGEGAMAQQSVTDLNQYGRAVVQWRGAAGLELHAREFEAEYFAPGHVHKGATGSLADAALGKAGVLVRFGADTPEPLMAEIYTFPTGATPNSGTIALSVEAEITADNCGREVEAQTLEVQGAAGLRVQDLTLFMPDCAATGDFLVLKNMLEDMTLAAR